MGKSKQKGASHQVRENKPSQYQKIFIILLLIATGAFFLLRSVNRELYCDEIMYGYKLNATKYGEYWTSPNTALNGEIKTMGDVISSQYNHYFYGNGRSVAHAIEQAFTGVIGVNAFYLLNTLLFIFTVMLFVRRYMNRHVYLSWLLAIVMILYLFPYPSKLWFSINLAPNYLLPLSLSLLLFYQFDKLKDSACGVSKTVLWTAPFVGLLAGWSNEAFAIPVAGGFFIYYLCNVKRFGSRVLLSLIPLWIGTTIMVLSPGNISRFMKSSGEGGANLLDVVVKAGENMLQLKVLWILVVALALFTVFDRKRLVAVIKENVVVVYAMIIGLLFGLVANTAYHSFTAIEFFAMILCCSLVAPLLGKIKYQGIVAVILTLAFCAHQKMIVDAEKTQVENQRALIREFQSNRDGVALYDNSYITPWVKPFVTAWVHEGASILYDRPFRYKYGEKRVFALTQADYNALPTFNEDSPSKVKVEGDSPFYYFGGQIFIASAQDMKPNDKYVMRLQVGDNAGDYEEVDAQWRVMPTRWGYFCYINYPTEATPLGIYHKK